MSAGKLVVQKLSEKKSVLLLIPGISYNSVITDVLKKLAGKRVCYVTLNKTYEALNELFINHHVDVSNIFFIDSISKSIRDIEDDSDHCYFLSSPGALTELSLVITKFLSHNFDYLIFDSITNLLIYRDQKTVTKFTLSLLTKIRQSGCKSVFYAINAGKNVDLIKEIGSFMDDTIVLKQK